MMKFEHFYPMTKKRKNMKLMSLCQAHNEVLLSKN